MGRARFTPSKMAKRLAFYEHQSMRVTDGNERRRLREEADRLRTALITARRCLDCGRSLSDEDSVKAGRGPDCRAKMGRA